MSDKKPDPAPKKRAPSVEYSDEVAAAICERIATGETLTSVCSTDDMPTITSVRRWVVNDKEGFAARYQRARELQADVFADEMVSLADTAPLDRDAIQKRRLQIDTRKWIAGVILPRKYGTSITSVMTGAVKVEHGHDYAELKNLSDDDMRTMRDILRRAIAAEGENGDGAAGGGSTTRH